MSRSNPLHWSFPIGTWFLTQVRVSIFLPVLFLVFWAHYSLELGVSLFAILFLSVFLHEMGHVVACRMSGGEADQIVLWPLGGLVPCSPGRSISARIMTISGGPAVNLLICAITLPAVIWSEHLSASLNPFKLPVVDLSSHFGQAILLLIFSINWLLLLINLIPVLPLDGGKILQIILSRRFDETIVHMILINVGFWLGGLGMVIGLCSSSVWVVFFSALLLMLNLLEFTTASREDSLDDSVFGYDFSQGYTSLERSSGNFTEKKAGFFQQWREKRKVQKQLREREKSRDAEKQLDLLLHKVHEFGLESLTSKERQQLNQVSARYRKTDSDT
ncbi:MAG: M50 family metallopeptidase [Planctomycetes bacterium]|nr:M50 family metallopeptidase [Planctomycetota bacterium]MCH9723436.1 M50 family metallopeptidase [Planctomycetota bacterium]MCH9775166.1 M50 family metallopeptidase [Planctomycetota bacterium]MDF1746427.1 M50 family metallopeptidase [Gimesia sp.]